jgi:hypothetical protein
MTGFVIFVVVMIVVSLITKARQQTGGNGKPNPRMQALIERIQAQQAGGQPVQIQGQFTQAAGGPSQGPPQVPPAPGYQVPGQWQPAQSQFAQSQPPQFQPPQYQVPQSQPPQFQPPQFQPPQFQPAPVPGQYPVQQYTPGPYQPPAHRPPQRHLPSSKQDLDARVRELMSTGNEVGAIRLLCDERDLGILDAQKYAQSLVAPQSPQPSAVPDLSTDTDTEYDADGYADEDGERYVGSAAFAESIFNLDDREETEWASGWVDTPEPDDRSDIDELWQTVSNPPRPVPPTAP